MGRAARRKWLARIERVFLAGQRGSSGRYSSWYETNHLFWGPVSLIAMLIGVAVTGMGALLWFSWFVSWITVWGITERISQPKCDPAYFIAGILLSGFLLYEVGVWSGIIAARITVESVDDSGSSVFGNVGSPAKVRRFARIKVTNVGRKVVANVKAVVLRLNDQEWRAQLPLFPSPGVMAKLANPPPIQGSVSLNPGEDQYFYVLVECNGVVCPQDALAVPFVEGDHFGFFTSEKNRVAQEVNSVTVRISGDGTSVVTETFMVSRGPLGQLMLNSSQVAK